MTKRKGRRPTQGPKWTAEEDRALRNVYPSFGTKAAQRRLEARGTPRTQNAIQGRVRRLKLQYLPGVRHDLVYLSEAHPGTQNPDRSYAHKKIIKAAEADGVMVRANVYPYKRMAPAWWVDEYMEKLSEENDELRTVVHGWLSTREVAKLFGFTIKSFVTLAAPSCSKRYSLHEYLDRIPKRTVRQNVDGVFRLGKYWSPEEAHREAERYSVRRARKKLKRFSKKHH